MTGILYIFLNTPAANIGIIGDGWYIKIKSNFFYFLLKSKLDNNEKKNDK